MIVESLKNAKILIKLGGELMLEPKLLEALAQDVAMLVNKNVQVVIVHGGGPQIASQMAKTGAEEKKIDGLRVTDEHTIKVVEEVLFSVVNAQIVKALEDVHVNCKALCGNQNGMINAYRKKEADKDLGLVGTVDHVEKSLFDELEFNVVPVVAPLATNKDNETLNVNADEAASAIASALFCTKLILMTSPTVVLDKDGNAIEKLNEKECEQLIKDKVIVDGMIPKVNFALAAVSRGVISCLIVNGSQAHALKKVLTEDSSLATTISKH